MKKLLLCLFMLGIMQSAFSQANPQGFYHNVVEIGIHDFGLLVGSGVKYDYFICVRPNDAIPEPVLTKVYYYRNNFTPTATLIKTYPIDNYNVALYQCSKNIDNDWSKRYYGKLDSDGQLATFMDNGLPDSIWFVASFPMRLVDHLKSGAYTVNVPKNADVSRGLPLINSNGYISGLIAQNVIGSNLQNVIDMTTIADELYKDSQCDYFNLIENGHADTRCVEEERERRAKEIAANPIIPVTPPAPSRGYSLVDFGIFGSFMGGFPQPNSAAKENDDVGTGTSSAGLVLYLNIDPQNFRRLNIGAGYGTFQEAFKNGIWKSADGLVTLTHSYYKFINLPVSLEFEFYRTPKFSGSFGIGYTPYYILQQTYQLKTASGQYYGFAPPAGAFAHRLTAVLNFFEYGNIRLGLNGARDIGTFPNHNDMTTVNSKTYQPYADRSESWYVGLELGIRFTGRWGVRAL